MLYNIKIESYPQSLLREELVGLKDEVRCLYAEDGRRKNLEELEAELMELLGAKFGKDPVKRSMKLSEEVFEMTSAMYALHGDAYAFDVDGESAVREMVDELSDVYVILIHILEVLGLNTAEGMWHLTRLALQKQVVRERVPDYKHSGTEKR